MTIGDLKSAWRDLPDSTEVFVTDERGEPALEYRGVQALEIERKLGNDEPTDCFNIRLEE